MDPIFSNHARLKMNQRGIPERFVLEAVHHPDFIQPSYNFREERYKNFGKNYLKAVVIEEDGVVTIITVHWIVKLKKK